LKFASDKFEERKNELIAEGKEKYLENEGVLQYEEPFFLFGPESRLDTIIDKCKAKMTLPLLSTQSSSTVEKNNPSLKAAFALIIILASKIWIVSNSLRTRHKSNNHRYASR